MPGVFNRHPPVGQTGIRIDRGTNWRNPFIIGLDGDRDEVCDKYEYWVLYSRAPCAKWIRDNIHLLKGQNLICHCKPARCHGDFLLYLANKRRRRHD